MEKIKTAKYLHRRVSCVLIYRGRTTKNSVPGQIHPARDPVTLKKGGKKGEQRETMADERTNGPPIFCTKSPLCKAEL